MSTIPYYVLQAARTAHEANRALCAMHGDLSQPAWEDAPANIKASAVDGVQAILEGRVTSPEESHYNWKKFKLADGWEWGPVKDVAAKTHPNIVDSYEDLPEQERNKDLLYFSVVKSFAPLADEAN